MKLTVLHVAHNAGAEWFKDKFEGKEIDLRGFGRRFDLVGEDVEIDAQIFKFGENCLVIEGYALDRKTKIGGRVNVIMDAIQRINFPNVKLSGICQVNFGVDTSNDKYEG